MTKPIEACYLAVGARIRLIREALGMSQEDLAKKTSLVRTSVVNIEAGRQRILLHNIDEFSKALGTSPKHLMKGIWW